MYATFHIHLILRWHLACTETLHLNEKWSVQSDLFLENNTNTCKKLASRRMPAWTLEKHTTCKLSDEGIFQYKVQARMIHNAITKLYSYFFDRLLITVVGCHVSGIIQYNIITINNDNITIDIIKIISPRLSPSLSHNKFKAYIFCYSIGSLKVETLSLC